MNVLTCVATLIRCALQICDIAQRSASPCTAFDAGGQDFDKLCSAVCGYLLLLLPRNVIAKVPDARALRIRSAFAALRSAF